MDCFADGSDACRGRCMGPGEKWLAWWRASCFYTSRWRGAAFVGRRGLSLFVFLQQFVGRAVRFGVVGQRNGNDRFEYLGLAEPPAVALWQRGAILDAAATGINGLCEQPEAGRRQAGSLCQID